jgi:hypothetical protein
MAKCLVDQSDTRVIGCTPKEETGQRASSLLQVMTWGDPCKLVSSPAGNEVGACIVCCVLIVVFDRG